MRKKSLLARQIPFMALLFFFGNIITATVIGQGIFSDSTWKFSNPRQFGFTVLDVAYASDNRVIAVGDGGGIAISNNGGLNWRYGSFTFQLPSGEIIKPYFSDVHCPSANTAYAVGNEGCMAKTIDGGTTWTLVNTPLSANRRNINTVWFINENKGYIGGQFNTDDSIPKLYTTNNGGATWDSLNAPIGGVSVYGYVANASFAPIQSTITAKNKEIYRIEFSSPTNGYITGGSSQLYPEFPSVDGATCLPDGFTSASGSSDAALVWRYSNGVLTDYSISKEKLGYTGIEDNPVVCDTRFRSVDPQFQLYRAINIINDSTLIILSFNNNIALKIFTGKNDSTLNVNIAGLYEKGRYEILNFPYPPAGATPIPPVQVLNASNPYVLKRAANGKLFATSGSNFFSPENQMWTSIDTGRNWLPERNLPSGQNFSEGSTWSLDISPSGKFIALGQNGVVADSIPGGSWRSNYLSVPLDAFHSDAAFLDCNNGILTGGSAITVTEDGGNTWIDRNRPDFSASFYRIEGLSFVSIDKVYFAVTNGIVYTSPDRGQTLDPSYANFDYQMMDVSAVGNDSVWAVGYSQFSLPFDSIRSKVFRSYDGGNNWEAVGDFPIGGFDIPFLSNIVFPSRRIGYVAGSRNAVYRTTDGGTTWTSINPFPALNEAPPSGPFSYVRYEKIIALSDSVVFVIGNMYTDVGVKRVYRSTDAGNTWTDITGNLDILRPIGNLNSIAMHDANSGYVMIGSTLFKTTDGGLTWLNDDAPVNAIMEAINFFPSKAPAGVPMKNRRLFVSGGSFFGGAPIMEYGAASNTGLTANEVVVQPDCSQPTSGSITLSNTSGGFGAYTYSIGGGPFQPGNSFGNLAQGTYQVSIKDAFCASRTVDVVVPFNDNLVMQAQPADTTVCIGATVSLVATSLPNTTFTWSPPDGLSATDISNPVATASQDEEYIVTGILNGCERKDTVNIHTKAGPVVDAGPDRTIIEGGSVQLSGTVTSAYSSVLWNPAGSLSNPAILTPVATPSSTTTYTLTVVSTDGCISSDRVEIEVVPDCIKVLNAFTPNGDGINDKWVIAKGSCFNQIKVKVVNRYGSVVYSTDSYQNDWNGNYKGKPLPDGTYYYVIEFKLINGRTYTKKGDVTILR
jgi:gliding motility-associated-like protein